MGSDGVMCESETERGIGERIQCQSQVTQIKWALEMTEKLLPFTQPPETTLL